MQSDTKYMNPYVAGVILGLILLTAIVISGRGLGASGAFKSAYIQTVETISSGHADNTKFFTDYRASHPGSPLKNWLVFEIIGVAIGGFLSGLVSNRLKFTIEKGPNTTSRKRIFFALIGGILFGVGSQLGRGCTSGAALSGMAVLSTAGFITMIAIFGFGYLLAYFARKLWI